MFASSFWLLIRTHNRARCQAEIPLIAPSEIVEPSLIVGDPEMIDGLYIQAAVTTMALIAATVWYAFSLVEQARGETEALLRNVLPDSVVERLKAQPAQPAQPIADTFDDASVLFADISGFVPLARELGAAKVVALLNRLVLEFDAVAIRYGLEKIKTIGDAYMAAGGLPVPSDDHAMARQSG